MTVSIFERINGMSLKDAAITYAKELGWKVFPLVPGTKRPLGGGGFHAATSDAEEIARIWTKNPNAGIGVACGEESGVLVLDVDQKHDGFVSYEKLIKGFGPHLETVTARTPNHGRHYFFRHPPAGARRACGVRAGIDRLGSGGYVVVSPTVLRTEDGKEPLGAYAWEPGPGGLAWPPDWFPSLKSEPSTESTQGKAAGEGKKRKEGQGRNTHLTQHAGYLVKAGLSGNLLDKALEAINRTDCDPPLPRKEIEGILGSAAGWSREEAVKQAREAARRRLTYADLSDGFLEAKGYRGPDFPTLRYWSGDFYRYVGTHYQELPWEEAEAEVSNWLRAEHREKVNIKVVKEIVADLKAQGIIPRSAKLPYRLDAGTTDRNLLSFSNGVLNVASVLSGSPLPLAPHSPALFVTASLPYAYDPKAECPRWNKFLEDTFNNPELREHLAEWFGYCLLPDTSMQKFVVFVGEGSNGKSCCGAAMRAMLGEANCSSVPLEQFTPKSFQLSMLTGKLANISGDMNEIDKVGEGLLKQIAAGDPHPVDKKYAPAVEVTPTARLTFITNNLPRIADRSDGVWRRLMVVPFNNQILDPKKIILGMNEASWWIRMDEAPGILNWALGGLARLRARGYFEEPEICRQAKAEYQHENNPHKLWIEDYLEADSEGELDPEGAFREYSEEMRRAGLHGLSQPNFVKEILRVFKGATRTNPVRRGGRRVRVLKGVKWLQGDAQAGTGGTGQIHIGSVLNKEID